MNRNVMIATVGAKYLTPNVENDEYSYVKEAGSLKKLIALLGRTPKHYKVDLRFEDGEVVVLIETKTNFTERDESQLSDYVEEERALHPGRKVIAILANTCDDKIKVWRDTICAEQVIVGESVLDGMEHYRSMFETKTVNDRERVLKNTFDLNVLLHKKDIDENKRSQFVGTILLYIKDLLKRLGVRKIDDSAISRINILLAAMSETAIRADIKDVLSALLDGSENKAKKIDLLQRNVLEDQKVKRLKKSDWIEILDSIIKDIYRYINTDSSEGQDILNLFFIAFNKYTGKADKNQAFTPDHITDFMCRVTDVDHTKVVMDITCGSGSFLVQAMVKELADCRKGRTESEARQLMAEVTAKHIYGIENEEKAYGLATTNMLIHGDGNSNIKHESCFDCQDFIISACPDIILMNPPYNAKPIGIPSKYKKNWGKAKKGKEDPTKGLVFVHYLSDVISEMNKRLRAKGLPAKTVKLSVLLPVSAAIGSKAIIKAEKKHILESNRLDAVFTLPNEIFYPGASVCACCMVFTLGQPHVNADGTRNKTYFGYYKVDGFSKKKNLGRVEQFDANNTSMWKKIEERWLYMFRNREVVEGLSAMAEVTGDDEWLCEAYMKTDYTTLRASAFQKVVNDFFAYLVGNGYPVSLTYAKPRVMALETDKWGRFRLDHLFKIKKGKRLTAEDQEDGHNIYIGAIESNNGVANHIGQRPIHKGNTLSISYNGSVGEAFYQPDAYWATDDVNVCYPKFTGFNAAIGLFIASVVRHEKYKFSYGRKWTLENMSETEVCLPVKRDSNGAPFCDATKKFSDLGLVPDWGYMEKFMGSLSYGAQLKSINFENLASKDKADACVEKREKSDADHRCGDGTLPIRRRGN